jgi:hypothetical protein
MRVTKQTKLKTINPLFYKHDIYSVNDIERKHRGYWFSKDTMRFFSSRVLQDVFPTNDGLYFVSSEAKGFTDSTRVFTVRFYSIGDDRINTVGELGQYGTRTQALSAALDFAYQDVLNNSLTISA